MSSAGCWGSTHPGRRSTSRRCFHSSSAADRPGLERDLNASLQHRVGLRRRLPGADLERRAALAARTADITGRVDGRITVISGTVQDVTARKQAETELAETLSQLSATLDSTADGILVVSTTA